MSATISPSTGRPYGMRRVCRTWEAPRSTVFEVDYMTTMAPFLHAKQPQHPATTGLAGEVHHGTSDRKSAPRSRGT